MPYHLSVFAENKPGRLEKITAVLAEAGINIRAVSMADAGEFGVVRILANDPDRGLAALKAAHFTVTKRQVLIALIGDTPGALHALLLQLADAEANVQDCYGFVTEEGKRAAIVIEVEKLSEAERALKTHGVRLVSDGEIEERDMP
jgi:hypothetical protein